MPSWMADVDERFNAPLKSIILITILSGIGVIMYAYLPILSLVDVTVAFEISYAIFALSVALMPFLRRELFETAVIVKRRILGIPVISLIGFSTFGFLVYITYITWGNPVLLPINLPTILSLVFMYGSGFAIYYIAKLINLRKGIDVGLVFKEIPPE